MTIVCAYQPRGSSRVWMGSDSRETAARFIYPTIYRKIYRVGEWLIGSSGNSRFDEFFDQPTDPRWTCVAAIRDRFEEYLKDLGVTSEKDCEGEVPTYSYTFLAARAGELWGVSGNGCLLRPAWGFLACGSGQDYAYGAAHALLIGSRAARPSDPKTCMLFMRDVIEAAIEFRGDCGGEIVVESIGE